MRSRILGLVSLPLALALAGVGSEVNAAEPAECASPNPPPPAKPYFLFLFDTSGSMEGAMTPAPSCTVAKGYAADYPSNRAGHARCAMYNTINAFGGLVNFGLMAFPGVLITDTPGANPDVCPNTIDGALTGCTINQRGCGSGSGKTRSASTILSPIPRDNYWDPPGAQTPSNIQTLLGLTNNLCNDCQEIPTSGSGTPINGGLRDAFRYLSGTFTVGPPYNQNFSTPLVGGSVERPCRSVNVILLTDGGENCDQDNDINGSGPVNAAKQLLDGFNVGGVTWKVKTNVIQFGPDAINTTNSLTAQAGGTVAVGARNEAELSQALANIITGAIQPEVCDNVDNNCNGCTDEGFQHYCNRGKTSRTLAQLLALPAAQQSNPGLCCSTASPRGSFSATTPADDTTCIGAYRKRLATNPDTPAVSFLPCLAPVANDASPETKWLCANPGEVCDEQDNNCDTNYNATPTLAFNPATKQGNDIDELQKKCTGPGGQLACPTAEVCDNFDNDCDGVLDNQPASSTPYSICAGGCQAIDEICNGCDENCNNLADDGVPDLPCAAPGGLDPQKAPNCQNGVRKCTPQPVAGAKQCVAGAPKDFYGACQYPNAAASEVCGNGQDDDCDGLIDEGNDAPCFPFPGIDPKNVDGLLGPVPTSRCRAGIQGCAAGAACEGSVGPLNFEVCNGIDDDCDGLIDEESDLPAGTIGKDCGTNSGSCTTGKTACVGGALVCQGGSQPQPEVCNGIDDDCDGLIDENPVDGPDTVSDPTLGKCWSKAPDGQGQCGPGETLCVCPSEACKGLTWCAPEGAGCNNLGLLGGLCSLGSVQCKAGGWVCTGGKLPEPEICDSLDNDCDGQINEGISGTVDCNKGPNPDGTWPGGACKPGKQTCTASGEIQCLDDQGQPVVEPSEEVCDGVDNDCDGKIDEDILLENLPCLPPYDTTLFPGDRSGGDCKPGVFQCVEGGQNGQKALVCVGGVGPSAEICDGRDNDCDGQLDEEGVAPDGITGTANPLNDQQKLGDACTYDLPPEVFTANCKPGNFACVSGKFLCTGGDTPQPEVCDCIDNDCDGQIDEDLDGPAGPLDVCTGGDADSKRRCVKEEGFCQCAAPCERAGEFLECPLNFQCLDTERSTDGAPLKEYCVTTAESVCGKCEEKRFPQEGAPVECGPMGQIDGVPVPLCICKGLNGCRAPCHNVTCSNGLVCTNFGDNAGKCVSNNCYNVPCPAGFVCNEQCVDNPCKPNPCEVGEVCKPSADFSAGECKGSCAGVTCTAGEVCKGGQCVPTGCGAAGCEEGKFCDGGQCVDDKCVGVTCSGAFAVCNPSTGQCGPSPCAGVVCPESQVCQDGECVAQGASGAGGGAGSGGVAGASGAGGQGASGGSGPGQGGGGGIGPRGVFGQVTGGGGCSVGKISSPSGSWFGVLLGLGWLGLARRRAARAGKEMA
jgi:hypothetical protein